MADLLKKIDDAGKGRSGSTGPGGSSRGFSPPLCGECYTMPTQVLLRQSLRFPSFFGRDRLCGAAGSLASFKGEKGAGGRRQNLSWYSMAVGCP
jgi:hypothetical protein